MDVDYIRQVPMMKERYTYTKSRTTNIFDDILHDDVPSIVRNSYSTPVKDDIPTYTSQYTPTSPYRSATREDDISFKARPNTDYVVNRAYSQYGALPRWNDTLEVSTQFPELRRSPSPFKSLPTVYSETRPTTNTNYLPSYVPRSSLLMDHDHPKFDRFDPKWGLDTKSKPERSPRPYFLQPELPRFYPSGTKPEDASRRVSSRLNTEFPFRKYRSDFVPYAPYHNMYDSMKYCPNPDWVTMRPWGHRFRKARFVYVPEEKNSSTSMEIERVMREARMRELCKGIYSSNYGDDIRSSVNLATGLLDNTSSAPSRRQDVKAAEAEIAPTQGEKERRKHRSLADKRKRNETLAVGLSRTELLKNDNESASTASSKLTTSSIPPREVTRSKEPTPPPKEPTPPPKKTTPPPKEQTPPPKEPTPPPKEPTPPRHEQTPPPKEPTPPPKEPTPPPKEPTPQPKEPSPPLKDPTPPPKDPTPPPKEPTPLPKELTPPPPKEPTPPPPKELTPPPPREPTPPPLKEPTPPPPKELTPPPPKDPTPPPPRELTPPCLREPTPPLLKEPTPPPNEPSFSPLPTEKELTPPPQKETSAPPKVEVTTPKEEDIPTQETSPVEETDNIADSVEEYKEAKETATNPEMYDQLNGNIEDSTQQRTETGHYMVEEVDNGDGQIIRTEYMIEEIEFSK